MSASDRLTRRALLRQAAATAGAIGASLAGACAPVEKVEFVEVGLPLKELKSLALYKDYPNREDNCGRCLRFVSPNACYAVYGPVSSIGWCRNFKPIA
jgi:hypothetical protein